MTRNKIDIKFNILLIVLFIALVFSLLSGISLGAVRISLKDTYSTIQSNLFHVNAASLSKSTMAIVWNIRIPRVIMGLIAGVGLALCGTMMQTTVNNPISEPYILGISAGATFGATFFIILGLKSMTGIGAFFGSVISTAIVMFIASIGKKITTTSLILSGAVVNALFSAFSNFIISIGANSDSMMTVKFWTMGSLASATWADILIPLFVSSLNRAEDLATAMEARGYQGGDGRSKYRVLHYEMRDAIAGLSLVAVTILLFVFKA